MTTINLLNQTALVKSVDQNSANIINLYLSEAPGEDQDESKYTNQAYPTPGATLFSAGSSVMRAMFSEHGVTYGIDGATFFSVASNGTRTTRGTLNTSTGWAKIRGISAQLLIADAGNLYYYTIATAAFAAVATTTYVSTVLMTAPGSNYSAPTAVINDSTGTGATVSVQTSSGQISGVTVLTQGQGYTAPTIVFSDSTGSGASATVVTTASTPPTSIQDIECQDEFGLALAVNSQTWQSSAISDLITWPALSFASTTGNQNYNQAIVSCHRELYILGSQTTEVWDNLGTAYFTFGRNQSAFIEWGCAARASVAKGDNTIFFLGVSPSGGNVVLTMQGYTPVKISTRAIDYQISTYTTVSDAVGFMYQQEGHEFYVLTFPTAGVTWVYDLTTGMWHQRQSLISGNQVQWLASCYSNNYNKLLIGDSNTGNIYYLDMSNNTDNGAAITRTLVTHPFYQSGAWICIPKVQIDFDNGPGANLANWNLYVSRDGGRTFGIAKPAIPQVDANGMYRTYWLRIGTARAYVLKLTTNANMQTIILGAWATVMSRDAI